MKKTVFILFVGLVFTFSTFAHLFADDDRGTAEGLKLDKIKSKTLKKRIASPNPHTAFECTECHKKRKIKIKKKKKKKKTGRKKKRSKKSAIVDIIKLCDGCHEGENLHPVNTNPMKSEFKITPPRFLPLGKGKYKDKITCLTCHDIHAKNSAYKLLRGFPGAKGAKSAKLTERQELCRSCHGDALIDRSPHNGDERSCGFCHISDPRKVERVIDTVRLDIVKRCNFCHDKLEEGHFLAVNAFVDKKLEDKIPDLDLPFIGGEITCVTCHDQHWKSTLAHRLRPAFVAFAEQSVRINPHWTGTFCLTCHDKQPKKGEELSFRFNGDFVKICNRCHETEEATADIHPVNIEVPPEMLKNVPEDFKLAEGNLITCLTCHELKYQTSINNPVRRINPKFLRGGPYKNRSDICYRCHVRENYERMNPHNQIDGDGNIIESKCLFCHSSRPDVDIVGIDKVEFTGNVAEYCYGCHAGKDEDHPSGFTHNGAEPTEERLKCIAKVEKKLGLYLPLYDGNVFCGTCHNPHQRGVQKGVAAWGADEEYRLRLPKGYMMCVACHCDKGDVF